MPHVQVLRGREVSARITVSRATLRRWRALGIGPAFVRLGPKAIGYLESDVVSWLEQRRNAEAPAAR